MLVDRSFFFQFHTGWGHQVEVEPVQQAISGTNGLGTWKKKTWFLFYPVIIKDSEAPYKVDPCDRYKWVSMVIFTPISWVISLYLQLVTGRGPPCSSS